MTRRMRLPARGIIRGGIIRGGVTGGGVMLRHCHGLRPLVATPGWSPAASGHGPSRRTVQFDEDFFNGVSPDGTDARAHRKARITSSAAMTHRAALPQRLPRASARPMAA